MFKHSRLTAGAAWLPLGLLVAAGCKQGPSPEVQARIDSLSQASSEKERLMQEVAENTRLVSEISKELATVAVPKKRLKVGAAESPLRASRDTMVQKIRYITARVKELEPKLQQSEQRVRELSTLSDSLKDALASTIQNLQGVIDNQKETIAGLTDRSEEHTSELQSRQYLVCRLLLEKKNAADQDTGARRGGDGGRIIDRGVAAGEAELLVP